MKRSNRMAAVALGLALTAGAGGPLVNNAQPGTAGAQKATAAQVIGLPGLPGIPNMPSGNMGMFGGGGRAQRSQQKRRRLWRQNGLQAKRHKRPGKAGRRHGAV